jgi:hypothetical protein
MSILQANLDFIEGTLALYFAQKFGKDGLGMTNEIIRQTYHFADLMRHKRKLVQGGQKVVIHTLLRKGVVKGFVAPYDVREVRETQHTVAGEVDWSVYEWLWNIEDIEALLNGADRMTKIFGLAEVRQEAGMTEAANDFEEFWWNAVGNADKLGQPRAPFPGQKYWITRDGYHVDGSPSVAGINVDTDPRWLNRYVGPHGHNLTPDFSHNSAETLANGNLLRRFMKKANRYIRFMSPNQAKMALDDKKLALMEQKIYADEIAYDVLEQTQDALAHGRDNLASKELDKPDPTFRGVSIDFVEDLGVGAGGLPPYVRSVATPSGRGTFAAGDYPNTGEVFMNNCRNLMVIGHEKAFPQRKPVEFDFKQQVAVQLIRHLMTTACNSRQRQCVLWGFGGAIAA